MSALPEAFLIYMKEMLGDEFQAFTDSYEDERAYGLRVNPLKSDATTMPLPFHLTPVPWAPTGFYANADEQPGKSPLHEAGAYYIQEPSAMISAELLDVQPGQKVCDLCAAPGGKSTQIAGKLQGRGLLVSNEIFASRARILSQNIERMGVKNAVVTNEAPLDLVKTFPEYFDRIMADAPCSGEGMFRKDENARAEWSEENVRTCVERQKTVLEAAAAMLAPGGKIVYSTCTFNRHENEEMIEWFLQEHEDFECLEEHRIWPHKVKGEGHFAALLKRSGEPVLKDLDEDLYYNEEKASKKKNKKAGKALKKTGPDANLWTEFAAENIKPQALPEGRLEFFGDNLYLMPAQLPELKGIHVERAGLWLGEFKKNRFEPAHSLAMALKPAQVKTSFELLRKSGMQSAAEVDKENYHADAATSGAACSQSAESAVDYSAAFAWMRGESVSCPDELSGWCLMTVGGYSIGWGKAAAGMIKNHYPKGLRRP